MKPNMCGAKKIQLCYSVHRIPEVGEPLNIQEIHPYLAPIFEVGSEEVRLVHITKVEELSDRLYKVYSGDTLFIVQVI